jgi:hypothetical protein
MPLVSMPSRTRIHLLAAITATVLLFALIPAGASAYMGPGEPVADPQVNAWLDIARATWGAAPDCAQGVLIDRAERLPGPGIWAAAEMPGCHISLDPDFYPAPAALRATAADRRSWEEQMCNVVVHEWGHLLGHDHSSDPHHVMAPFAPRVVAGCRPSAPAAPSAGGQATGRRKKAAKRARANKRRAAARRAAGRRSSKARPARSTPQS